MRIINEDTILEMAKLIPDYADESLCGDFGDFIYFSPSLDAHGPRVKFYGGTKETSTTRTAPSLAFTNDGKTEVKIAQWMNKKNCPNAFNDEYVRKVSRFVNKLLPILLLVWYDKLDEARALKYFEGSLTLNKLMTYLCDVDLDIKDHCIETNDLRKLHKYCLANNIYKF